MHDKNTLTFIEPESSSLFFPASVSCNEQHTNTLSYTHIHVLNINTAQAALEDVLSKRHRYTAEGGKEERANKSKQACRQTLKSDSKAFRNRRKQTDIGDGGRYEP